MRAFVIGITLLALLFGGFVFGVEAGTHPLEQAAASRIVATKASAHTVTVSAVTTVVDGHTKVIRLASTTTRVVVIRLNGKKVIAYVRRPAGSTSTGAQSAAAATLYSVTTETVTEPPQTVTQPPVTVTVTESGTTDTSATSNASSSTP